MCQGKYQFRPEPPFVPGVEAAGVVVNAPPGSPFSIDDRITASTPLGAWAERARCTPHTSFRIPDGMSFAQATAMVNYQTAYFGLVDRGQAESGETLLVHGAAGGAGSAAVDVGTALGMRVIAVARGHEKQRAASGLGADQCIDADDDWREAVKESTDGAGADVVFDPVGGDGFLNSVRSLAVGGRLLVVGFAAGSIPEVKVNRLLLRNSSVVGVAWGEFVRSDPAMPGRVATALEELWAADKIDPLVGASFALEDAAQALDMLAERRAIGKMVLNIRDD
jgi:NADPH2:quinone reductase